MYKIESLKIFYIFRTVAQISIKDIYTIMRNTRIVKSKI